MTTEEKLSEAYRLIEEAWGDIVPDIPPRTNSEESFFDAVEVAASRILSDIEQMVIFTSDA